MKSAIFNIVAVILLSSATVKANNNFQFGKVSIETNADASKVIINWNADNAGECYFEVERSFDQVNYQTAGIVLDAISLMDGNKVYRFKDVDAILKEHSTVYYRLKRINNDKTITLSKVIYIDFTNVRDLEVNATANLTHQVVNVDFMSEKSGDATVNIFNSTNQLIANTNFDVIKGSNVFQLAHMNNFPEGSYIVEISLKGKKLASHKVVIR